MANCIESVHTNMHSSSRLQRQEPHLCPMQCLQRTKQRATLPHCSKTVFNIRSQEIKIAPLSMKPGLSRHLRKDPSPSTLEVRNFLHHPTTIISNISSRLRELDSDQSNRNFQSTSPLRGSSCRWPMLMKALREPSDNSLVLLALRGAVIVAASVLRPL